MSQPTWLAQFEMAARLVLAAALGAIIGWKREKAHKPAGLRTQMLIAIGAALFTIVSINGFIGGNPSQVAAGVVTGIGFLGAGAIMHRGRSVEGLTTAASIWAVAAIGLAVGGRHVSPRRLTAIIVFLVLYYRYPGNAA